MSSRFECSNWSTDTSRDRPIGLSTKPALIRVIVNLKHPIHRIVNQIDLRVDIRTPEIGQIRASNARFHHFSAQNDP